MAICADDRRPHLFHPSISVESLVERMSKAQDSEFVFLYTTISDRECANAIARALVEANLAACVNIFPLMVSCYKWEGRLEETPETAMLIKTRRTLVEPATEAARKLHPYSVPCFLVLPIESGNEDYLAWARVQTDG